MRKYNRDNCDCFIRKIVIDIYQRTIVLSGKHAFEWSITIYEKGKITQYIYPNGRTARKEFYRIRRLK